MTNNIILSFSKKTLALVALLASIAAQSVMAAPIENGVSHQLAQERTTQVSHVSYHLGFSIPSSTNSRVSFSDTIRFDWNGGKTDLQIDFSGHLSEGKAHFVNGRKTALVQEKEHVIVPAKKLRKGTNQIILSGESLDQALNRHSDYLYTLFVPANARTVFPCFDQPDIKAYFHVSLQMPDGWTSITSAQGDKYPIPTYLFSFTAGRFHTADAERDGRTLRVLYRETDADKVAQIPQIFDEVALSIRWMEQYTGIVYPFIDYKMAILPGYQFGGMEHPGAIQYKDRTMFLPKGATPEDKLARLKLIAHETAHMWFGDMVTMRWFDDVWTKEVYANFMAAKISGEHYPDIDPSFNDLRTYQLPALSTDRTMGTHPIQQPLDNLSNAGLLYGNIIYDKAPVMMQKLEMQMGEKRLRQGLQTYLKQFAYKNTTWDDLIQILDQVAPDAQLPEFSRVWVKEKGMPTISTKLIGTDSLEIQQTDSWGRGLVWPQTFHINVGYQDNTEATLTFATEQAVERVPLPLPSPTYIIPNPDGMGYGRFMVEPSSLDTLIQMFNTSNANESATQRLAMLYTIYDHWLMGRVSTSRLANICLSRLNIEQNEMLFSHTLGYISQAMKEMSIEERYSFENKLFDLSRSESLPKSHRQLIKRQFYSTISSPELSDSIYNIWSNHDDAQLTERHFTAIAYRLAIQRPNEWKDILAKQRSRLKNEDDREEFDFVSRACTPSAEERLQLFNSLLNAENRRVETWARSLLTWLCDYQRGQEITRYLEPALDILPEIQQTGAIFFPNAWLSALLANQQSDEARSIVGRWIDAHEQTVMPNLMNKLKERAYFLLRK